jgi:hypothetical protein
VVLIVGNGLKIHEERFLSVIGEYGGRE